MVTEKYVNSFATTLNGAINNSITSIVVTSATGLPTTGNVRLIVDSEIMIMTSRSGTTLTVLRGQESTGPTSHLNGAAVTHILTSGALDAIRADIMQQGPIASLPAAEKAGRFYQSNDYPINFIDDGANWIPYFNGIKLTPPVPGAFSWTNGGGSATNTTLTNGPTDLSVTSTGVGDKVSVFTRNVPTAPYIATAMFLPRPTPQPNISIGVCLYDGTKVHAFGILMNSASPSTWGIWSVKYSTLTAFSAIYAQNASANGNQPTILRIEDDNTNRILSYSMDGRFFTPFHSVGRTDFLTPTKIGMFLLTNMAATANGVNNTAAATWLSWTQ